MRVEKCFFDINSAIDATTGLYQSLEVPYLVFEVDGEETALQAVTNVAPTKMQNLYLDRLEIDERLNANTFKVRANYDPSVFNEDETQEQEPSFNFDTAGGSKHLTQSLETVAKFPNEAPDFSGAIEVDHEGNVNGVDIAMPLMNFSETHYLRPSKVNTTYKRRLAELTGSVNDSSFRGYDAGEVLFLGAHGSRRGKKVDDYWEITFKFAVSPNTKNLKIGSLTISNKTGWDYLWVRYADDVSSDNKALIKKPEAAYVEKVYEEKNFGRLGIGR